MKKVAIIGGGQLARLLALAGTPKGIMFSFLLEQDESDSCIAGLGDSIRFRDNETFDDLYHRLGRPDVVTVDNENVCLDLLEGLSGMCTVHPNIKAIKAFKNRLSEKLFLTRNNIPTSKFYPFFCYEDLVDNWVLLDFPMVIKSCEGGYDGKMQFIIRDWGDLEAFKYEISPSEYFPNGFIAEKFVEFEREISFIAARSVIGDIVFYPPAENTHKNAILVKSIAPAKNVDKAQTANAQEHLSKVMNAFNYVGILTMECFETKSGELMVNEIAPRVHNSGHWTQVGCKSSQFDNHLNAILGQELAETETHGLTGMINVLGKDLADINQIPAHANLNWYYKEKRSNRKMGHINLVDQNYDSLNEKVQSIIENFDLTG